MPLDATSTRNLRSIMPGKEAVTLRVRVVPNLVTTFNSYTLSEAKWFTQQRQHGGPENGVPVTQRQWLLWDEVLDDAGAPEPKHGDFIVQADGTTWIIQSVGTDMFGNDHLCETIKKVGA